MDHLSPPPLLQRLLNPARRLTFQELAENWYAAEIEAVMPGYGVLVNDMTMMRRIRGALGAVLLRSASPEAIARKPCPWEPPCALDVLFREQARLAGGRGIPKPWALASDRHGPNLVIRVTLFGMAADWAPAVSAALAEALVHGVAWRLIRPDIFLPRPAPLLRVRPFSPAPATCIPTTAVIELITPIDSETTDLEDVPWALLPRIARRAQGMARWFDAHVDQDFSDLAASARDLNFETGGLTRGSTSRFSSSEYRKFEQRCYYGSITVNGILNLFWFIIVIGSYCNVGRSTNSGYGRIFVK